MGCVATSSSLLGRLISEGDDIGNNNVDNSSVISNDINNNIVNNDVNNNDVNNDDVNNKVALLQLPPELFRLIIGKLGLHGEFVLSQTCYGLRSVFSRDWDKEISGLRFEDRLRFWAGLASTLPGCWACPECCRLHPIDTTDTPTTPQDLPCGANLSLGSANQGYSVRQHHVQNALKLSRRENRYQQYLAGLMRSYTITVKRELMFEPTSTESYTANPRLIDNRFILQEEWIIGDSQDVAQPLLRHVSIPACPHLCVFGSGLTRSIECKKAAGRLLRRINQEATTNTLLERRILSALERRGQSIYISCPRCRTDCEIMASSDGREATVRAWHDLGGEGAPKDTGWDVHVRAFRFADWFIQGPRLEYTKGSIRRLWLDDTS